MFKKISMLSIMIIAIATNSFAGPFGLNKGTTLKEIGIESQKLGHGIYKLKTVPKPHSAFEEYIVKIAPKGGLYWIKAIGKDVSTSTFGIELKGEFHEMEGKLEAVYGKHKKMDFLMSGSIWKEPEDWMMGLLKKDRILVAIWEKVEGSSLPEDIEQIGLIASPISRESGYIAVEYSFVNKTSCKAELDAQEDDAL